MPNRTLLREQLLRVGDEQQERIRTGEIRLATNEEADALLHKDPFAFLLGCVAQQGSRELCDDFTGDDYDRVVSI